jgi:hypothetical protein
MAAAGRAMQGMTTDTATGRSRNGSRRDFVLPVRLRRATVKLAKRTAATACAAAPAAWRYSPRSAAAGIACLSSYRPDRAEELSRIASTIGAGKIWGRAMTAGDYVAAAALIVLILCGVKGILTQDKFRL